MNFRQSCRPVTALWLFGTVVGATSAWSALASAAELMATENQTLPAKSHDMSEYLSVGVGWLDGLSTSHASYEKIDRAGIGVPMVAHGGLYWGLVGVGAMLFANVNSTLPAIGAVGSLSLGNF